TDTGYYNAAKILNAAAASLINRRLYAESLPKTDDDLAAALSASEPALAEAQLDPQLLAALRQARTAIATDHIILQRDVPAFWVCRACGEVARDEAPEHCPQCGAGQLTFQTFPAAYYLEPLPVDEVLSQLNRTPDWLDGVLRHLSAEQLAQRIGGAEGEWSLIEAAGHLLDSQYLIAQRVNLFFESESPALNARPLWQLIDPANLTAAQIAERFRQARSEMLVQLHAASSSLWIRVGQHSEFGPVTLQQQVSYFAKHEQWHMAQITRIMQALTRPN
ncbi:MAG TPA: DinB family protein, partial [Anaerolineae bacterium]